MEVAPQPKLHTLLTLLPPLPLFTPLALFTLHKLLTLVPLLTPLTQLHCILCLHCLGMAPLTNSAVFFQESFNAKRPLRICNNICKHWFDPPPFLNNVQKTIDFVGDGIPYCLQFYIAYTAYTVPLLHWLHSSNCFHC